MQKEEKSAAQIAADRVIEMDAELEAAANAAVGGTALENTRSALLGWIEDITGIVASPALGRVTLIHSSGRNATIISPDLAFLLTAPINHKPAE